MGALAAQIRIFDVIMQAPRCTTYNAFVVKGQQGTALVELVKQQFASELPDNIAQVTDSAALDFIILNHTEPDHSGALEAVLQVARDAEVVCSSNAARFVEGLLNRDFSPGLVRDGDEIYLGGLLWDGSTAQDSKGRRLQQSKVCG